MQMKGNRPMESHFVDYTPPVSDLDINVEHVENYDIQSKYIIVHIFQTGWFQNIYKKDLTLKSLHKRWCLID